MSDLISRQAAISAICNACGKIDCDKMDKCEKLQLPPANSSEFPNNSDAISRQAAIDAIVNTVSGIGLHDNSEVARYGATFRQHEIIDIIEGLPPAEPKIIRCKDCKHWDGADTCDVIDVPVWDNDFCSMSERRSDE